MDGSTTVARSPRTGDPVTTAHFAANVMGALCLALADRMTAATGAVAGGGGHFAAALVTLRWYPDQPVSLLAGRLQISHPGAVQLVSRLEEQGLAQRSSAPDGRHRLVCLTEQGRSRAEAVLAQRRRVLEMALSSLAPAEVDALTAGAAKLLDVLAEDLVSAEHICRLCDELACPDDRCPVERAEPAPPARKGDGYRS